MKKSKTPDLNWLSEKLDASELTHLTGGANKTPIGSHNPHDLVTPSTLMKHYTDDVVDELE